MTIGTRGLISSTLTMAATMAARTAAWQEWCGVDNADDAARHIYRYAHQSDEETIRTLPSLIFRSDLLTLRRVGQSKVCIGGSLMAVLSANNRKVDFFGDGMRDFDDLCGLFMAQMLEQAYGDEAALDLANARFQDPPGGVRLATETAAARFFQAVIEFPIREGG